MKDGCAGMSSTFDNKPRIAHVLFMDVVSYSQLPTDRQVQVRNTLREVVRAIPEFSDALRQDEVISRDTGDGMALAFFGDLTAPVSCARKVLQAVRNEPPFELRIGIHTGPVYVDTDMNSTRNLAGDGINIAQRVMDCGDGGHILVSESTAHHLAQFSTLRVALHDLGGVEVKHRVRVHIFNVFVPGEFGNPEIPSKVLESRQRNGTLRRLFSNRTLVGALLLLVLAIPAAGWWFRDRWLRPQLPATRQLVVLPFESLNHNATDQAFCDGLVELLTSSLTQAERFHKTLWVIPSADVRRLHLRDVAEARNAFAVNLAVTGSLQTDGTQLLMIVNLSDANSLRQIASRIVPVTANERELLLPRLTSALLDMLDYGGVKADEVTPGFATKEPSAYELYVQGRGFLQHAEASANVDRAIEVLEKSVALDPTFAMPQAALADAYIRRFNLTKKREWLAKADQMAHQSLNLDSNQAYIHLVLGRINRATGEFDQSISEIQQAIAMDPRNMAAYTNLAMAYADAGRPSDAEKTYLESIRIRPGYWPAYSDLGVFYELRGEYAKALEPLSMAVKLAPNYAEGHDALGSLLYYLERFDEALAEFNKAIALQPSALAYSNRGGIFALRGDYVAARNDDNSALQLDKSNPNIWGNLGVAEGQIPGRETQSLEAFKQAVAVGREQLAVNPKNADLLARMAYFLGKISACEEARTSIGQAWKLAPDKADVIFESAKVAESCHDRESALKYLSASIKNGYPISEIQTDPDLVELRRTKAYAAMQKQ